MSQDADTDTAKAVIGRWNDRDLDLIILGGLHEPPLATPRPSYPYGTIEVKQGPRKNERSTGLQYIDYRKATITLRHTDKTALRGFAKDVEAVFLEQAMAVPNTVGHMRNEPLEEEEEPKFEGDVEGKQVFARKVSFCVWTHRQRT